MATVRDKLWLWSHQPDAHGPTTQWKLPRHSRITPLEAAVYMGIPNVHMVWMWRAEEPEPRPTWKRFALPLNSLKQVVWSIAHGHGLSYTDHIFPLIDASPNVTGVILDDFFTPQKDGRFAALTLEELDEVRTRIDRSRRADGKPRDLWCVVYEQDMGKPVTESLQKMDVLAYFMWNAPNVPQIESHVEALERLMPAKRKVLGLYMWDYAGRKPMPLDLVKHQSAVALKLLKAGRIEGICFVASCICDLELEAVEWTREWIAKVADEQV